MLRLVETKKIPKGEDNLTKVEIFDGGVNYLFVVKYFGDDENKFILAELERKIWEEIDIDNYELNLILDLKTLKYNKVGIRIKSEMMNIEEVENLIELQSFIISFVKEVEDYLRNINKLLE